MKDSKAMGARASSRSRITVLLGGAPLPFFAEYPYFLWGEVDYDSDGDCVRPTDQDWHWLYFRQRGTGESVTLTRGDSNSAECIAESDHEESARLAALLTGQRSMGNIVDPDSHRTMDLTAFAMTLPDIAGRLARVEPVRKMFLNPALEPFDSFWWWGGWKWSGPFASEFAKGARMTMLAVQEGKADPKTMNWLRERWNAGPTESEREGLRAALTAVTGMDPGSFDTKRD